MKKMNDRYNETGLSQRELDKKRERDLNLYFRTSYSIDFTKKKINRKFGWGKVNAFVGGDMVNPKLSIKRDEINANYIRKNQAVLSQSKTGVTTYQHDYCGMRRNARPKSIGLTTYN